MNYVKLTISYENPQPSVISRATYEIGCSTLIPVLFTTPSTLSLTDFLFQTDILREIKSVLNLEVTKRQGR